MKRTEISEERAAHVKGLMLLVVKRYGKTPTDDQSQTYTGEGRENILQYMALSRLSSRTSPLVHVYQSDVAQLGDLFEALEVGLLARLDHLLVFVHDLTADTLRAITDLIEELARIGIKSSCAKTNVVRQ